MSTSQKKLQKRKIKVCYFFFCLMFILTLICAVPVTVNATDLEGQNQNQDNSAAADNGDTDYNGISGTLGGFDFTLTAEDGSSTLSATLQILLLLTVISLAPSILIMVTSFTRILIVLHFTRSAIGTQTTPPNQIMIGLALFLTLFIMAPVLSEVNDVAIKPLTAGDISQEEAFSLGIEPVKNFMFDQMGNNEKDLNLFIQIAGIKEVNSRADVPIYVLIPAFILNELRTAFLIGFFIYLPFIVIDMVVASTLMSMGMMMLPPTTISMPFKILLFVMADGWNLVVKTVVESIFYRWGG